MSPWRTALELLIRSVREYAGDAAIGAGGQCPVFEISPQTRLAEGAAGRRLRRILALRSSVPSSVLSPFAAAMMQSALARCHAFQQDPSPKPRDPETRRPGDFEFLVVRYAMHSRTRTRRPGDSETLGRAVREVPVTRGAWRPTSPDKRTNACSGATGKVIPEENRAVIPMENGHRFRNGRSVPPKCPHESSQSETTT